MRFFPIIALLATTVLFCGCAPRVPNFYVEPTWTEKPTSISVVYNEPIIENQDDLEDDLGEYADNFDQWFNPELKKNLDLFTKNSIEFSLTKVDSEAIVPDTATIQDSTFTVPSVKNMDGDGVYLVLSNIIFSRREDAYMHHGPAMTVAKSTGNPNAELEASSQYYTELGLWVSADYAYYDAQTGNRLAFGRWAQKSKFTYAMTKGDWEKCVKGLVKKILVRTPILKH
jgi:hypothetical protein